MNTQPIKVLVIHNNPIAQAGLTAGFRRYGDIELVDEGHEVGSAEHPRADVVVTDFEGGMALTNRCRLPHTQVPPSKVMIVCLSDRESDVRHALERGVRGYMLLDSEFDDLADGVREVHMGARVLCRRITQQLAESMTGDQLTSREAEVLRLVVNGMCNKMIARQLNIAIGTVKSHLKSIFDKLNVESRTQAIAVSMRRGILSEQ